MQRVTRAIFTFFALLLTFLSPPLLSQEIRAEKAAAIPDSIIITTQLDSILIPGHKDIDLSFDQALRIVRKWYRTDNLWNNRNDSLRQVMSRLLFEVSNQTFYESEQFLRRYNWDNIRIPSDNFFMWDTLHILVESHIDNFSSDSIHVSSDSTLVQTGDVHLAEADQDSLVIENLTDSLVVSLPENTLREHILIDSIVLVVVDTLREVISTDPDFPFRYYNYPMTGDTIQAAIDILLSETLRRDSSLVIFKGSEGYLPVWLSNDPERLSRLWLRNEWGEDVSVWIGSSARDTVNILVERGVHFMRFNKETNFANAQIDVKQLDNKTLADPRRLYVPPDYWKFISEVAFTFNQAVIKNWSKGGESNIAFTLDLQGTADYTNKAKKISWNSIGRFKFGYMASGDYGVRKNVDQIDISSKFNNKAFGKFDFSTTMIFKTQLAYGYAYPNDSVIISKFFNPASLTLGVGLDYKPNSNTSINFAPLSYKGTYVPDTVNIDQTKHGLLANQRARHEPGMSVQIDHKMTLWKDITIINKVRLFTNYIHNPLNVDIDWEMIATAKLNWFTDIRLNTHLIYDDDTLIPLFNKDGTKVLAADGSQKKVANVQFKEIIGLSVIFRF